MKKRLIHLSKSEKTKKMILEKAAELFSQKGYSAVTMKDVCEQPAKQAIYRHFGSTGEMLGLIIIEEQRNADNKLRNCLDEGKSALQILDALIEAHTSFLLSPQSALELAANQYALLDPVGKIINKERAFSTVKRTAQVIRIGQEKGVFIDGDPVSIAWHIVFFLSGIHTQKPLFELEDDFICTQINYIRDFLLKK